jgi:hypothetical protein
MRDALDRGESSVNDAGEEAMVARADAEIAEIGLCSSMGNEMAGMLGKLSTYMGYKDIGSVAGDFGISAGDGRRCGVGMTSAGSAIGDNEDLGGVVVACSCTKAGSGGCNNGLGRS